MPSAGGGQRAKARGIAGAGQIGLGRSGLGGGGIGPGLRLFHLCGRGNVAPHQLAHPCEALQRKIGLRACRIGGGFGGLDIFLQRHLIQRRHDIALAHHVTGRNRQRRQPPQSLKRQNRLGFRRDHAGKAALAGRIGDDDLGHHRARRRRGFGPKGQRHQQEKRQPFHCVTSAATTARPG